MVGIFLGGCSYPAAPTPTITLTRITPTPDARPLSVAVPVASPSATPELVGDYATLVRPRLEHVQQDLAQIEQRLAELQKTPVLMAQDDWRNQMFATLDDLALSEADIRSLSTRVSPSAALGTQMTRFIADLDFVVGEWRMALGYDPDATHFLRAGRAEKTTADELASILAELPAR
jgi:hypothetical protein